VGMASGWARKRIPRRAWWPVGLLLLMLAGARAMGRGSGVAPWLERAIELAGQMEETGVGFLTSLPPLADPRLGPATLLSWIGMAPEAILLLFQLLAGLSAAAALLVLGSRASGRWNPRWGAYLMAVSPLIILAVFRADPHLLLGLLFLLLGSRTAGRALQVVLLAWGLSWSPWAWAFLWLPAAGSLLSPRSDRRWDGPVLMAVSVVLMWLLNPAALMQPAAWAAGLLREARVSGLLGSGTPMGLDSGWWPLLGTVHGAGLILLLASAAGWPARLRGGDLRPLAVVAMVWLGSRSGFAGDIAPLIALPWACGQIGAVAGSLAGARGFRRHLAPGLLGLAIAGLLFEGVRRLPAVAHPGEVRSQVADYLEETLPAGSLVLHDVDFPPPPKSELVYCALPFHATLPDQYRGAYWWGWFQSVSAFVASERLVVRYVQDHDRSEAVIRFYAGAVGAALSERTFGAAAGRRLRLMQFAPDHGEPLAPQWRTKLAAGVEGALPEEFVAALGGALAQAGMSGAAVELLEEAQTAGYRGLGIYLNLANAQLALGRIHEAGRVLDEGAGLHPHSPELLYNLGLVLTRAGLWDRAVRTLLRVQRAWPRSGAVCYLLGMSLAHTGRPDAAAEQLERALRLDPDLPERPQIEELLASLRGAVGE